MHTRVSRSKKGISRVHQFNSYCATCVWFRHSTGSFACCARKLWPSDDSNISLSFPQTDSIPVCLLASSSGRVLPPLPQNCEVWLFQRRKSQRKFERSCRTEVALQHIRCVPECIDPGMRHTWADFGHVCCIVWTQLKSRMKWQLETTATNENRWINEICRLSIQDGTEQDL